MQQSPFLLRTHVVVNSSHLQLPSCIDITHGIMCILYTCSTSNIYNKTQSGTIDIFINSLQYCAGTMNDDAGMTDEHEVHGAFILTDLLDDTIMVSSQVVIS